MAFLSEQASQHSHNHKGMFKIQFIDLAHQGKISIRYRARLIIHAAPINPEQRRLPADAQIVIPNNQRIALPLDDGRQTDLVELPGQKSSPARTDRSSRTTPSHQQAEANLIELTHSIFPLLDLVRMKVEWLRQLWHRPVALQRRQRHLGLKCCAVVPSWSPCHRRSFYQHHADLERILHLSWLFRFPKPSLVKYPMIRVSAKHRQRRDELFALKYKTQSVQIE